LIGAAMLNPVSPKAMEQTVTAFISEYNLLFISTSKQLFTKDNNYEGSLPKLRFLMLKERHAGGA
jgi:hypothetical protein